MMEGEELESVLQLANRWQRTGSDFMFGYFTVEALTFVAVLCLP